MLINCFRPGRGNVGVIDDDRPRAVRPCITPAQRSRSSRYARRQNSENSSISNSSSRSHQSNESISKLPPCKRESDAAIEAILMPLPEEGCRPSKCLRLSFPKIYGDIVTDMKAAKGCRDWKNFAVFEKDEVDMTITADEAARKRMLEYQRRVQEVESTFEWSDGSSPGKLNCAHLIP